jgi:long-subunit acyl-CoA synthetase (AMP-forming)
MVQDVKLLVEDIGTLKPTILCAVPRVLDRIFSGKGLLKSHIKSVHILLLLR